MSGRCLIDRFRAPFYRTCARGTQLQPIVRRLGLDPSFTDEERSAVLALPTRIVDLGPGQDIVRQGDRPFRCVMVLEGLLCTAKTIGDGRRQILAFHIAGDMPDLQSLHLELLDNDVTTITAAKVALVDHGPLRELCARFPRLAATLWRISLIDAAIYREWIANIGQRQAVSRVAHVFCEMMLKMHAMGLAEGNKCVLPLTQSDLCDATGMSIVHVNRSLQQLRATGSVSFARGVLTIHNWRELEDIGDFEPSYLHLPDELTSIRSVASAAAY